MSHLLSKILIVIYYITTGLITNLIKPKIGETLARRASDYFRDTGDHRFRNLMIIPPWAIYFSPRNIQSNSNRLVAGGRYWNYYKLLCYDLKNEPLRHDTVEALLRFCFNENDYESCLDNAKKQKIILEHYAATYCDDRYKYSILKIDTYIYKCQKAIEKNCYRENYNLCFIENLEIKREIQQEIQGHP